MRILVVDDDADTCAVLVAALTDDGHEVLPAADGAAALTYLAAWRPELILLDLFLPGIDGWAFTDAYQQVPPPHAPIVLLTAALVAPEGTVAGRALPPAAGVLPKPFDLDALTALVGPFAFHQGQPTGPALAKEAVAQSRRLVHLRARLATIQADLRRLLDAQMTRPWSAEMTQQGWALCQERNCLSQALRHLRQEVERVRTNKGATPEPPQDEGDLVRLVSTLQALVVREPGQQAIRDALLAKLNAVAPSAIRGGPPDNW